MNTEIATLAKALNRSLCSCNGGACALEFSDPALCCALMRLIAEGRPVPMARLAEATGKPLAAVTSAIAGSTNVELDEQGRIVGTGITLHPTAHRVDIGGRTLYAWCALDTLMYLPLLGERAEVESPCAATGAPVRVTVTRTRVESTTPSGAVVSIVVPASPLNIRQSFCNHIHFFSSARAAEPWKAERPGAVLLSVSAAYELGRLLTAEHGPVDRGVPDVCPPGEPGSAATPRGL